MNMLLRGARWSVVVSGLLFMSAMTAIAADEPCTAKADGEKKYVQEYIYHHEAARLIRMDNENLPSQRDGQGSRDRTRMEDRVSVTLERMASEPLSGFQLYRAYNSNIDPAWVYTIAVGQRGEVYRLGGFETDDFNKLLATLKPGLAENELLNVVQTYYRLVQGFDPGVLRDAKEVSAAKTQISAAVELSVEERGRALKVLSIPRVETFNAGRRLRVSVFDQRSLRLERHDVRVSAKDGLNVERKEVVLDRYRLTY